MKSTPAATDARKAQLDEANAADDFGWRLAKARALLAALTTAQTGQEPDWMTCLPPAVRGNVLEVVFDVVADLERVHNEAHS